jgi:hypothetical protein
MAINGLVDAPPVITLDQFLSRADQILTFDIHCDQVSEADFSRSRGLVEEQEAYLVGQGIRLTTDAASS